MLPTPVPVLTRCMMLQVGALPALWTSAQEPLKVLNKNRTWFCSDPRRDDFSLDRLVQTSVELAYKYGWDSGGYNVDDESGQRCEIKCFPGTNCTETAGSCL